MIHHSLCCKSHATQQCITIHRRNNRLRHPRRPLSADWTERCLGVFAKSLRFKQGQTRPTVQRRRGIIHTYKSTHLHATMSAAGTDWDLLSSYAGLLSLACGSIYAGAHGSLSVRNSHVDILPALRSVVRRVVGPEYPEVSGNFNPSRRRRGRGRRGGRPPLLPRCLSIPRCS